MDESFTADFFAGNRAQLRKLFTGTAPIILTAHGLLQKSGDEFFPFQQDNAFWYLTGVEDPDVILVMDKAKEYLIVPDRDAIIEIFDGVIEKDLIARRSGITEIYGQKEGWKQLKARLKKVKHVATFGANPPYIDFYGMYTNPARRTLIEKMKSINADIELLDIREHVTRMRTIKQPVEIQSIRRAVDITVETFKEIVLPSQLAGYKYEYEIEAEITRGFRRRGALGHSFTPVVAAGKNTCTMHHVQNNGPVAHNDLLLLDIGASFNHYAADIARTYVPNGKPSKRQQKVYDAVLEAQDYAISLLKPGVRLRDYEKLVETFVGEKLRELGVIKVVNRETVRESGMFPHLTTHHLGLDTHDATDYDEPLKPGMVMVAEPGIYIRDENIGVRIEDDLLVTETGVEVLSSRLPRSLV
jgi:Xaa-Pro aminopeptidase